MHTPLHTDPAESAITDAGAITTGTASTTGTAITTPVRPDTRGLAAVHHCWRNQFGALPQLVRGVPDGDTHRAEIVADFVAYLEAELRSHHTCERDELWPLLDAHADLDPTLVRRTTLRRDWIATLRLLVAERIEYFASTACPESRIRLADALEELSRLVNDQLDDEERAVLPAIEQSLNAGQWNTLRDRPRESATAPSELVFLGYLLQGTRSMRERRQLLSTVPVAERVAWHLTGRRRFRRHYRRVFGFRPIR